MNLKIAIPPFPYSFPSINYRGCKLEGLNEQNLKHIWLYNVCMNGSGRVCSGSSGDLGYITARSEYVREVRRRAYRTAENLTLPDIMFRRDVGERVIDDCRLLKQWGWLSIDDRFFMSKPYVKS